MAEQGIIDKNLSVKDPYLVVLDYFKSSNALAILKGTLDQAKIRMMLLCAGFQFAAFTGLARLPTLLEFVGVIVSSYAVVELGTFAVQQFQKSACTEGIKGMLTVVGVLLALGLIVGFF